MQKILSQDDNYPQKNSTECKGYEGVQTVIGITENHLVEVNFTTEHLMEYIFSPGNLNNAYLQVKRNAGASGVDKMEVEELLPYLRQHKEELVKSLMQGTYRPNPVRRVEIPKDNHLSHYPISAKKYDFLSHNSFIDCSEIKEIKADRFAYNFDTSCGKIEDYDMNLVIEAIKNSKNMTPKKLKKYNLI